MGIGSDLYRVRTDFNFPRTWRVLLTASAVLVLISAGSLVLRGLNLSIDFRGGTVWEVPAKSASTALTTDGATKVLAGFNKEGGAKIQTVTDANGRRIIRVQAEKANNVEQSNEIARALTDAANADVAEAQQISVNDVAVNTVGPSWGASITKDAIRALIVFFIVIALYMSWTLEWRMALSALVAVVHDVVITLGFYSVFNFEVTPATVISVLTILGFSLYDTIVVYDRVRENGARHDRSGRFTYSAIMRRSLNQVLMRSVNTTFVAILPVAAILVVGGIIYGQPTMFDFSLALLVGLVAGAYSSIAIAAPVLVWFKEREPRYARIRSRAVERGPAAVAEADWIRPELVGVRVAGAGAATDLDDSGTTSVPKASPLATKAAQYQRAHPPRPRKQGKKR